MAEHSYLSLRDTPDIVGNEVPQLRQILNDAQDRATKYVSVASIQLATVAFFTVRDGTTGPGNAALLQTSLWISLAAVVLLLLGSVHFPVSFFGLLDRDHTVAACNRRFRKLLRAVELLVMCGMLAMIAAVFLLAVALALSAS